MGDMAGGGFARNVEFTKGEKRNGKSFKLINTFECEIVGGVEFGTKRGKKIGVRKGRKGKHPTNKSDKLERGRSGEPGGGGLRSKKTSEKISQLGGH